MTIINVFTIGNYVQITLCLLILTFL